MVGVGVTGLVGVIVGVGVTGLVGVGVAVGGFTRAGQTTLGSPRFRSSTLVWSCTQMPSGISCSVDGPPIWKRHLPELPSLLQ
ncbi:hypothetical protein CGZ94_01470 [Enemella evansiae]|uniref:Uncharacterized protein n=1 Tax=Enemella evansiae TaxID=2016499 RepID=A0A255GQA9_9ACTN|nr:hypothetical protein CGZ94_01470 [Enemella evansiae]